MIFCFSIAYISFVVNPIYIIYTCTTTDNIGGIISVCVFFQFADLVSTIPSNIRGCKSGST